ncbi:MAG: cytochrome c biogenesis protein CcdA [Phycisphaerae bacterium]
MTRRLLAAIVMLTAATAAIAQGPLPKPFSEFPGLGREWLDSSRVVSSHTQVTAGQTFDVALDLRLAKGWAYDSPDPGKVGLPAGLKVDAGKLVVGEPLWPADKPVVTPVGNESIVTNAYEGRVIVYVPVTVPPGTPAGDYTISLTPTGQVCTTGKGGQCIPLEGPNRLTESVTVKVDDALVSDPRWSEEKELSGGLATAVTAEQLKRSHAQKPTTLTTTGVGGPEPIRLHGIFSKEDLFRALDGVRPPGRDYTVPAALALALLAGLILNIMPCVLPVIPLKVLSIAQMAGQSRWQFVKLSLAFIAGIMLFFAGLAAVNVIVHEATRQALNWGEHFQSTGFRIAMAMVIVAVAANLFGVFNIIVPARIASLGDEGRVDGGAAAGHGVLSAVGGGLLTAILSTPCSFGYLTTAFAWAQAQTLWLGSAAILVIGVGMALPYLVLMAFPGLVSHLPRPGRWMELFKQAMGFVMVLVAVWLIGTVGESTYGAWVAAYGTVFAFCLWVWGTWVRYDAPLGRKLAVRGGAALLAVAAGLWMLQPPKPLAVHFEPFDEAKIAQYRAEGKIVLVDFTANWCLTCKTVEELVYNDPSVAAKLKDHKPEVVAMKGDITTRDLPANKMLFDELKEPGVPVSVVFPPTGGGGPQRQ